ncbi:MAG: hypothetical protein ACW98F_00890 [Candidatus Hodarchaeales archaeon]|jgi:hypothetical protein
MLINAEVFQLEEDFDNNLWLIDFRDEKLGLRGRMEIPSKLADLHDAKNLQIEVVAAKKKTPSFKDAKIALNAISYRTRPTGKEKIYSFSSGGLMFRLFSGKVLSEFKLPFKEYLIIVR